MSRLHRVVLVEDHALLAQSLGLSLRLEGFTVSVAPLTDAESVLGLVEEMSPCLALLDLELGPMGDGIVLIPPLTNAGARVVVVTGVRDEARLAAAVGAGATGLVSKETPLRGLVETVHRAATGEELLDTATRERFSARLRQAQAAEQQRLAPFVALTRKEQEVLRALIAGK